MVKRSNKKPLLSIIIPAYNEKTNFNNGSLKKVWEYLKKQTYLWEVIVVDDGSIDGSEQLIKKYCKKIPGFKVVLNPHLGKAGAVSTGVNMANGRYVLFTDFDQSTPLSEVEKLFPYLKKGYQVVIGSREVFGAKREKEPFYRHLMGRGFNFGVKVLMMMNIEDTQCGFKAFTGKVAKELFSKLRVYKPTREKKSFLGAFDVEILFIARKLGYKIAEVPISWRHIATNRLSPIKDSIRMAIDVVKIRLFDFLGFYGK